MNEPLTITEFARLGGLARAKALGKDGMRAAAKKAWATKRRLAREALRASGNGPIKRR
jgi:hypothetical protein